MITTKLLITEKIRRILAGGYPGASDRVQNAEITLAVGSVANTLLKGVMYDTVYNTDGESIPPGIMICNYERLPVLRQPAGKATVMLPVQPQTLPEGQGVFSVYPSGFPEQEYIPVPAGIYNLWIRDQLVSPINKKLYSVEQDRVVINSDLIGAGITQVDMKLCIFDISRYDNNAPLPISPDQEMEIIKQVVALYSQEPYDRRSESNQPQPQIQ